MSFYTYKVVPAPSKGRKVPGVKAPEARFALGLEEAINQMARDGWEYLRADILPSEERQGLTSTQTVYRSVLVFRRAVEASSAHPTAPAPEDDFAHPTAPAVHLPETRSSAPSLGAAAFAAEAGESLRRTPPLTAATPQAPMPSTPDTPQEVGEDAPPETANPSDAERAREVAAPEDPEDPDHAVRQTPDDDTSRPT